MVEIDAGPRRPSKGRPEPRWRLLGQAGGGAAQAHDVDRDPGDERKGVP